MLLLYILLLSCCLSGSTGNAIEEFQVNFKALMGLESKETFVLVPVGKFQCNRVPCHLERTVEQLKVRFKNDQMREHVSLMEKNMEHIISTLKEAHPKLKTDGSCRMTEWDLPRALRRYEKFFEELHENCYKPS